MGIKTGTPASSAVWQQWIAEVLCGGVNYSKMGLGKLLVSTCIRNGRNQPLS